MVGEVKRYNLEEVLSEKQVADILRQVGAVPSELVQSEVRPAAEGLTGFLGDHLRILLELQGAKHLRLFVKRLPPDNRPKAEFIDTHNYFRREALLLQLIHEMKGAEGPNPWGVKAYLCSDTILVLPDLAAAGYREHALQAPLDRRHVLLAAAALARFHASFATYETNRALAAKRPYSFYQNYKHLLLEPTFNDSPWVRTAAKLSADLLQAFSDKYPKGSVPGLEDTLAKSYVAACESLDVAEDDLNVVLHKDLWNNNILFKYEGSTPTNAVLIDYQCVRYGPPAYDLMSFLYLTTSRTFRDHHEAEVLHHYFQVFSASIDEVTKKRLDLLGYDEKQFLRWCGRSRMFGAFEAAAIFPQVLMDAEAARRVFDDPETFAVIVGCDRSPPVVEYAQQHAVYRARNLEVTEEYVERFILGQR